MPTPPPPIESRFKPGESGNPNGRPKGTRNRMSVARKWLEGKQTINNPLTGKDEELEQQDIMTLVMIKKAREGSVAAYKELMDSAYGKAMETVDHLSDGGALPDIVFVAKQDDVE